MQMEGSYLQVHERPKILGLPKLQVRDEIRGKGARTRRARERARTRKNPKRAKTIKEKEKEKPSLLMQITRFSVEMDWIVQEDLRKLEVTATATSNYMFQIRKKLLENGRNNKRSRKRRRRKTPDGDTRKIYLLIREIMKGRWSTSPSDILPWQI